MLDLNKEVESQVLARAQAAGTSAGDYIAHLLKMSVPAARHAPRLRVLLPDEVKRRHAASIAHLQAQLDESEKATPAEIAEAEAECEWQVFQRAMNDTCCASGERILYKEDEPR